MPPPEEVPPGAPGAPLGRRGAGSGRGGAAGALSVGQREVVRGIAAAAARSLRGPATINFASKANRKQNDAARRRLVQLATEAAHQTNPFRPAPAAAVRAALAAAAAAERDRITKSEKSSKDTQSSDLDPALVFAKAGRREPGKVGHPHYLPAAAVFRHAALRAVETALLRHDFAAIAHLAAPLWRTEPPETGGNDRLQNRRGKAQDLFTALVCGLEALLHHSGGDERLAVHQKAKLAAIAQAAGSASTADPRDLRSELAASAILANRIDEIEDGLVAGRDDVAGGAGGSLVRAAAAYFYFFAAATEDRWAPGSLAGLLTDAAPRGAGTGGLRPSQQWPADRRERWEQALAAMRAATSANPEMAHDLVLRTLQLALAGPDDDGRARPGLRAVLGELKGSSAVRTSPLLAFLHRAPVRNGNGGESDTGPVPGIWSRGTGRGNATKPLPQQPDDDGIAAVVRATGVPWQDVAAANAAAGAADRAGVLRAHAYGRFPLQAAAEVGPVLGALLLDLDTDPFGFESWQRLALVVHELDGDRAAAGDVTHALHGRSGGVKRHSRNQLQCVVAEALRPAAWAFLVDAMASRWRWWSRFHLQGRAPFLRRDAAGNFSASWRQCQAFFKGEAFRAELRQRHPGVDLSSAVAVGAGQSSHRSIEDDGPRASESFHMLPEAAGVAWAAPVAEPFRAACTWEARGPGDAAGPSWALVAVDERAPILPCAVSRDGEGDPSMQAPVNAWFAALRPVEVDEQDAGGAGNQGTATKLPVPSPVGKGRAAKARVQFAPGPLAGTVDGHPAGEGARRVRADGGSQSGFHSASKGPALTKRDLKVLEAELGEENRASIVRLKRRLGLEPPRALPPPPKKAKPHPVPAGLAALHELLEGGGWAEVIAWDEDGAGFTVRRRSEFVREVLPAHFKATTLDSFKKFLKAHGFVWAGPKGEQCTFRHVGGLFRRGRRDLLGCIPRAHNHPAPAPATGY